MENKNFWSKIKNWFSSPGDSAEHIEGHSLDDEGLMAKDVEETASKGILGDKGRQGSIQSIAGHLEGFENLQTSLNKVVDKLQVMNNSLQQQLNQHSELMEKLEQMPQLVKGFPSMQDSQEKISSQLARQIADMQSTSEQFVEAVERIPAEMGRQTDLLEEINEQLSIEADSEDNMASGFRKFNDILNRLNQNTFNHTESILQMSKTFATSEKYLKYVISRQNRMFIWLFAVSISVCFLAIAALAAIIIYLSHTH